MSEQNILLLTATIAPPPNARLLKLIDPTQRMEDYRAALHFYLGLLGNTFNRIVFVDNSNSDLSILQGEVNAADVADKVELLSYAGLNYPPDFGRGYGEMRLADYAMANSLTCRQLGDRDRVWKVTGRYVVKNLASFIRKSPPAFGFYAEKRGLWLDMRILAWTRAGHERYVRGNFERLCEVRDGQPSFASEMKFGQIAETWPPSADLVLRHWSEPYVQGRRGYDGKDWSRGKYKLVFLIRSLQRLAWRLKTRLAGGAP